MRCAMQRARGVAWVAAAIACPLAANAQYPASPAPGTLGTSSLSVQTLLTQSAEFDSNPLLAPTGGKALYGSVTSPQVTLTSDTPTEHLDLDMLMDANVFNLANYGSEDGHALLNWSGKSAHWQAGLKGSFDYDTTRTSETTTSGVEVAGVRHTGASVAPSLTYSYSEIDLLTLAGSYAVTRYSDTSIFANYMQGSFTPSYTRVLDQTDMVSVTGVAQHYETRTGQHVEFDDFGGNVGWKSILSQTFSLKGDVGAIRRISTYDAVPLLSVAAQGAQVWELTFDAAATYTGLQDTVSLSVSRSPTPLSVRAEADQTKIYLNEAHFATPKIELDLIGSYQFSGYSGNQSSSGAYLQKNYVSVNPKVQYHLTDTVSFSLGYSYRRQQTETLGSPVTIYDPASSNQVMFVISFTPYRKDW